jgi:hypothetical protein
LQQPLLNSRGVGTLGDCDARLRKRIVAGLATPLLHDAEILASPFDVPVTVWRLLRTGVGRL